MSRSHRLRKPIIQQQAVGQVGQVVMMRQVRHPLRHRARLGDIVKNHHGAGHLASAIVNGRSGILYGGFNTVAPDQDAAPAQSHSFVLLHGNGHRIHGVFGICAVDNPEHLAKRPA